MGRVCHRVVYIRDQVERVDYKYRRFHSKYWLFRISVCHGYTGIIELWLSPFWCFCFVAVESQKIENESPNVLHISVLDDDLVVIVSPLWHHIEIRKAQVPKLHSNYYFW